NSAGASRRARHECTRQRIVLPPLRTAGFLLRHLSFAAGSTHPPPGSTRPAAAGRRPHRTHTMARLPIIARPGLDDGASLDGLHAADALARARLFIGSVDRVAGVPAEAGRGWRDANTGHKALNMHCVTSKLVCTLLLIGWFGSAMAGEDATVDAERLQDALRRSF